MQEVQTTLQERTLYCATEVICHTSLQAGRYLLDMWVPESGQNLHNAVVASKNKEDCDFVTPAPQFHTEAGTSAVTGAGACVLQHSTDGTSAGCMQRL